MPLRAPDENGRRPGGRSGPSDRLSDQWLCVHPEDLGVLGELHSWSAVRSLDVAVASVRTPTNLDLLRELDEARSEADKIIDHIQKRLSDLPFSLAGFKRLEFVFSVREVRRHLEEVFDHEQRDGDAGGIRKAILAIWLQVTRLAGMLEALLEPR